MQLIQNNMRASMVDDAQDEADSVETYNKLKGML